MYQWTKVVLVEREKGHEEPLLAPNVTIQKKRAHAVPGEKLEMVSDIWCCTLPT